ncbi:MAG: signal peptidase I [Mogibacterium sp.]|nr:signal peptidase I [Mogibacterium sp.]
MEDIRKNLLIDIVIALILAAIVLFFIRPTVVKQTSMQDTLQPNDYLIMYKRAYVNKTPQRGDIVIFQSSLTTESGKRKLLIKRVIGLPGDIITIKDDQLYINGEKYEEDYLRDGVTSGDIENLEVPKEKYFVMGDNRLVSVDSRYDEVGCVSLGNIKGKAVFRLYPFNKIGKL